MRGSVAQFTSDLDKSSRGQDIRFGEVEQAGLVDSTLNFTLQHNKHGERIQWDVAALSIDRMVSSQRNTNPA